MGDYRLTAPAEAQLIDILAEGEQQFGAAARERYAALLVAAMNDLAERIDRVGVNWPQGLGQRVGLYHVRYSRRRTAGASNRVRQPRHLMVFRVARDGIVEILGVIHERMYRERALKRIVTQD